MNLHTCPSCRPYFNNGNREYLTPDNKDPKFPPCINDIDEMRENCYLNPLPAEGQSKDCIYFNNWWQDDRYHMCFPKYDDNKNKPEISEIFQPIVSEEKKAIEQEIKNLENEWVENQKVIESLEDWATPTAADRYWQRKRLKDEFNRLPGTPGSIEPLRGLKHPAAELFTKLAEINPKYPPLEDEKNQREARKISLAASSTKGIVPYIEYQLQDPEQVEIPKIPIGKLQKKRQVFPPLEWMERKREPMTVEDF